MKCFRESREELRTLKDPGVPLAILKYALVAEQVHVTPAEVEMVVREWIYRRLLKYLKVCRRRDMIEFFKFGAERGLRTEIFSDYPARE